MMISSTPVVRKLQTIVEEMRELMMVKAVLGQNYGNVKIDNHLLYDLVGSMQLDFFHEDRYAYGSSIRSTRELIQSDADFLFNPTNKEELSFATNGSFLRGCVRIKRSENPEHSLQGEI